MNTVINQTEIQIINNIVNAYPLASEQFIINLLIKKFKNITHAHILYAGVCIGENRTTFKVSETINQITNLCQRLN